MTSRIEDRIKFITGLQQPTEHQALLVSLHEQAERTPAENKLLQALLRAEAAADRAKRAGTAAGSMVRTKIKKTEAESKARAYAELKARNQQLISLGELVSIAGLQDRPREQLLGLLIATRAITDPKDLQYFQQIGAQALVSGNFAQNTKPENQNLYGGLDGGLKTKSSL